MTDKIDLPGIVLTKSNGKILVSLNGQEVWCRLGSRHWEETPVPGDKVTVLLYNELEGELLALHPRRNKLSRRAAAPKPGAYPQEQVIAANLDVVVPVFSITKPALKWNLLDRYLVMAEAAGIPALICITKLDQLPTFQPAQEAELRERLALYRSIGYPVVETSCVDQSGIPALIERLHGRTSILMGKSGVGKTSLMNLILPGQDLRVGAVSEKLKKGRHTTSFVKAYTLDSDSHVIDAPGMRELGLWDVLADELAFCFPEMRPYLGLCKFGLNCQHEEEPGCALRQAVMNGKIDPYRYASYLRLKEEDEV